MSDQELVVNYLSILKSNVEVYVHGTIESSNKKVREVIKCCLDETLNAQERTFNELVNANMYEVSNVKSSDIKKVCSKLCQKRNN